MRESPIGLSSVVLLAVLALGAPAQGQSQVNFRCRIAPTPTCDPINGSQGDCDFPSCNGLVCSNLQYTSCQYFRQWSCDPAPDHTCSPVTALDSHPTHDCLPRCRLIIFSGNCACVCSEIAVPGGSSWTQPSCQ